MMDTRYDVRIRAIRIGPVAVDTVERSFGSFAQANDFVVAYFRGLPEVTGADLAHKYALAVRRYNRTGLAPSVFSHPEKGVVVRHLVMVTRTSPCYSQDEDEGLFG